MKYFWSIYGYEYIGELEIVNNKAKIKYSSEKPIVLYFSKDDFFIKTGKIYIEDQNIIVNNRKCTHIEFKFRINRNKINKLSKLSHVIIHYISKNNTKSSIPIPIRSYLFK